MNDEWRMLKRVDSFAEIGEGQIGLVIDSYGLLAIALDRRSAAGELGIRSGTEVRFQKVDDAEGETSPGVDTPVELGQRVQP